MRGADEGVGGLVDGWVCGYEVRLCGWVDECRWLGGLVGVAYTVAGG